MQGLAECYNCSSRTSRSSCDGPSSLPSDCINVNTLPQLTNRNSCEGSSSLPTDCINVNTLTHMSARNLCDGHTSLPSDCINVNTLPQTKRHHTSSYYVNINFAESLKFYENCKDRHKIVCQERLNQNSVGQYDRTLTVSPNGQLCEQSQEYMNVTPLTSSANRDSVSCQTYFQFNSFQRSKTSLCNSHYNQSHIHTKSISDPEIHLLKLNHQCSEIVLTCCNKKVRSVTSQNIQNQLCSSRNKEITVQAQYQSYDTVSSDTVINTSNCTSWRGSLNSEESETLVLTRFLSKSDNNREMSVLENVCKTKSRENLRLDLEKSKEHIKIEQPQESYGRSSCSSIMRSQTFTFQPGHNRDSSSSNDSGVSTASSRQRHDFSEFEMPITTALSANHLQSYAPPRGCNTRRRSKSIDPLSECEFHFQETKSAKSSSTLLTDIQQCYYKGMVVNASIQLRIWYHIGNRLPVHI